MLNVKLPSTIVFLSLTVVTGGKEHLPETTSILAWRLPIVFFTLLVGVGIRNVTDDGASPLPHAVGYFTENPSSSFLYSEILLETTTVCVTGTDSVEVALGFIDPPIFISLLLNLQTTAPAIARTMINIIIFFMIGILYQILIIHARGRACSCFFLLWLFCYGYFGSKEYSSGRAGILHSQTSDFYRIYYA